MSVAGDIADAVAAAVAGVVSGAAVVRRKVPALPPGKAPPEVCVSVGEEGDTEFADFENGVFVRYPVAVTVVTAGGSKLADDDDLRDDREAIRKAVDDPVAFAAVPEFLAVRSAGRVPFDTAALDKDLNFSIQVFTVTTVETRN